MNCYIDLSLKNNFQAIQIYSNKGTTILAALWCQRATAVFVPIVLFHFIFVDAAMLHVYSKVVCLY
jgi:hypothetical protein